MSTIKVNTIQHTSGANAAITLSSNGAVSFANTVSISGKINANNTTTIDNVAVTSTSTNSYISVTSSSGGGQMMMQSYQGTLGTIGSTNNIPVELITNNIRRMLISTNGYVTKPYQPAVLATRTTHVTTTLSPIIFDNIVNQTGSSYNASTGYFTCPVTGWYFVSFSALLYNMGSASYAYYAINGGQVGPSTILYGQFTGSYAIQGAAHLLYCNANDTLSIGFVNNGTNLHSGYIGLSITLMS